MKIDREYAPRVEEPAYGVVDRLGGGERLVSALMGYIGNGGRVRTFAWSMDP